MFLKKIDIENFRLFDKNFIVDNFNIPDNTKEGSGLTLIVGENGCGKTSLLDAISMCMLDYKASSFNIYDMNSTKKETNIIFSSNEEFKVDGSMPNSSFIATGFRFKANLRSIKSKSYLQSPIVFDQYYINKNPNKPKPNSPDLRLSVNNPFSGKRYNDTDILFLDKNRIFQIKSGSFNNTRFDRLMGDFNSQYVKAMKKENMPDLNEDLNQKIKIGKIENIFLENAVSEFEKISSKKIWLDFINNYEPFSKASFIMKGNENIQIPLSSIGAGYEMIFSLIYSYYLAKQNDKKIIILIDEPELHLHPDIQKKFVDFLLKISIESQIILSSHSPILVKQLLYNDNIKTVVINNDKTISEIDDFKLPYLSANEINYLAFGLATEEYHNELYEELNYLFYQNEIHIKDFDAKFFITDKNEQKTSPWKGKPNEVSIHTFIRNQIHHRKDNGIPDYNELKKSIEFMRNCF